MCNQYLVNCTISNDTSTVYLWLACNITLPVRSCPALAKIGFSNKHLTWYQCVSASVGEVDNHTVRDDPAKATSNQNAKPWTVPVSST